MPLVELVVTSQQVLQSPKQRLDEAKLRIGELEKKLGRSSTAKIAEPLSPRADERR